MTKQSRFQKEMEKRFHEQTGKTFEQREMEYKVKHDAQTKLRIYNFIMRIIGLINTILLFLFIGLRACDVINWKWYWIIAPYWIPIVLGFTIWSLTKLIFK